MYYRAAQAHVLLVLSVVNSLCFLNNFSKARTLTRTGVHSAAEHADASRLKHGGKGHRYVGIQRQSQSDRDAFPSFPPRQQHLFNAVSADRGQAPVTGHEGISFLVLPRVRCGSEAMIITFQQQGMDNFLIERLDLTSTPLPLSHLPSGCGLSVRTTWTEVVLIAHYNGCFILREENKYILPVVWHGSRMKAYCPVRVPFPRVVCKASSMDLMVFGDGTINRLKILLNGKWVTFHYAAERCRFLSYASSGSAVFSIPFTTCGPIQKDSMYRIYIRSKEREMELSCPLQIPPLPTYQYNKPHDEDRLLENPQAQTILDPNPPSDILPPEAVVQLSFSGVRQQEQQKFPDIQQQNTEVDTQHPSSLPIKVSLPFTHYAPKLPARPPANPAAFELSLNFPIISNRFPQPSLGDISSVEHHGSELWRLIPALIAPGLSDVQQSHQELPIANLQQHTNQEISPEPHFLDFLAVPPPPYDSHMDPSSSVPPPHI